MIRRMIPSDRELFLAFTRDFYASEAVLHDIPEQYHTAAFDEIMRSDVYADGFMIYDGDEIAGYGLTAKTYSHEAGGLCVWFEELYFTPEHRGKGLGSAFFAFAEQYYGKALRRVRLETEPENERAEKLYKRLGYEELAYRPFVKEFPEG